MEAKLAKVRLSFYCICACAALVWVFSARNGAADTGLDVILGIIEKASRTDKELNLEKYFDDNLNKAFKKSLNDPNGGLDFPWWFPRSSYKGYEMRVVNRSDVDVSIIIDRNQGKGNEEHIIEYVLRKNRNVWKIFDVKELPAKDDPPSTKVQSLREWLGLR